jgi:hypothetical protein
MQSLSYCLNTYVDVQPCIRTYTRIPKHGYNTNLPIYNKRVCTLHVARRVRQIPTGYCGSKMETVTKTAEMMRKHESPQSRRCSFLKDLVKMVAVVAAADSSFNSIHSTSASEVVRLGDHRS